MITWDSFSILRLSLMCNGPNMSMSVLKNGGVPTETHKDGICPMSCSNGFLSELPTSNALCCECFGRTLYYKLQ